MRIEHFVSELLETKKKKRDKYTLVVEKER